ncbi:MAG: tryptophan--tRNA ligase [Burkholderiaceae bacterium]|nr:tryptophan--tRNA ligase [Burkholderiaceae bacterium]
MSTTTAGITRVLTGITTTGTPHLGNYVGAIRPSVAASRRSGVQSFYFLADFHGLIKCPEPERIRRSTLEIAASWLAAGLDPAQVVFYRQSDITEIPELTWLLTCVTSKGLLNRAHAYKAAVDRNAEAGVDADADVTAGLFMYPVLMAADILAFNAHQVPVGRDQVQHLEMTRDIAQRFNHLYGEHFVLPEAVIEEEVATLPGLDGRKMSKSYDNTIALFGSRELLQRQIASIVTDSRAPGEPKSTEGSALFQLFQAFATQEETAEFRQAFADGISWGEAKERLFQRVDREIAPMRARYDALVANPAQIESALAEGARKARALVSPLMTKLRHAVGLRNLASGPSGDGARDDAKSDQAGKAAEASRPSFKQYRERDGRFYFKLVGAQGRVLLQSRGFESPREAGDVIAALQRGGAVALAAHRSSFEPPAGDDAEALEAALQRLAREE